MCSSNEECRKALIREESLSNRQMKGMLCDALRISKECATLETAHNVGCDIAHLVEHLYFKQTVVGSTPTIIQKAKSVSRNGESGLILHSNECSYSNVASK
jgi:hypothetical protein